MSKRERIEDLEHRMREIEYQHNTLRDQIDLCCLTPNPAQLPNGTWERCSLPAGHDDAHRANGKRWQVEHTGEMVSWLTRIEQAVAVLRADHNLLERGVEDLEKRAIRTADGLRGRVTVLENSLDKAERRVSTLEATTASAVRVGELEERVESLAESYNGHEHSCACGHPRADHEPATEDKQYTCKWDACICRAMHD